MFSDDYQQDSIIFTRRIQHLVNDLKTRGIECNIEIPQTIAVSVDGDIVNENIQHNGDHVRGERDRNSTNDSKAKTIVHVKPKNIHVSQIKIRKEVETEIIYQFAFGDRPNDTKKRVNKTDFAKNHTIKNYYYNAMRDAAEVRKRLNPNLFPPDFTFNKFASAENRALSLEHRRIDQKSCEKGFKNVEQLDILEKYAYCQQPNATQSFVVEKAQKVTDSVIAHSRNVQTLLIGLSDKKAKPDSSLKRYLNSLFLNQQSEIFEFREALVPCGMTFSSDHFDCFDHYYSQKPVVELPRAVRDLRETIHEISLNDIDILCADLEVDVFENHPAGLNKLSKNYLPGLTQEKVPEHFYLD